MALKEAPEELRSLFDKGELQLVWVMPGSAQENPLQWKDHPPEQINALDDLIYGDKGVGWAGAGLINDRRVADGWTKKKAVPTWLDGHARENLGLKKGDVAMPALVGHWSERDEEMILATLDPVGMLARYRPEVFQQLRDRIGDDISPALEAILDDTSAMAGLFDHYDPPTEKELDDTYGAPTYEDSWPVIYVRVPQHSFVLWQELRIEFDEDHKAMTTALELAAAKHLKQKA